MCVERQICGKMPRHSPEVYEDCLSKVIVGRQRVEESPKERTHFTHAFFILNQEQYAFLFANV